MVGFNLDVIIYVGNKYKNEINLVRIVRQLFVLDCGCQYYKGIIIFWRYYFVKFLFSKLNKKINN